MIRISINDTLITHIKMQFFPTGADDMDNEILSRLEPESIMNLCKTNKELINICNSFCKSYICNKYINLGEHVDYKKWYAEVKDPHFDVIGILYSIGINFHMNNGNLLILAARFGYEYEAEALLEGGTNVHAQNDQALIDASAYGNKQLVHLLLKFGANVHAQNNRALIDASKSGNLYIVRLLIYHGASITQDQLDELYETSHITYKIRQLLDNIV